MDQAGPRPAAQARGVYPAPDQQLEAALRVVLFNQLGKQAFCKRQPELPRPFIPQVQGRLRDFLFGFTEAPALELGNALQVQLRPRPIGVVHHHAPGGGEEIDVLPGFGQALQNLFGAADRRLALPGLRALDDGLRKLLPAIRCPLPDVQPASVRLFREGLGQHFAAEAVGRLHPVQADIEILIGDAVFLLVVPGHVHAAPGPVQKNQVPHVAGVFVLLSLSLRFEIAGDIADLKIAQRGAEIERVRVPVAVGLPVQQSAHAAVVVDRGVLHGIGDAAAQQVVNLFCLLQVGPADVADQEPGVGEDQAVLQAQFLFPARPDGLGDPHSRIAGLFRRREDEYLRLVVGVVGAEEARRAHHLVHQVGVPLQGSVGGVIHRQDNLPAGLPEQRFLKHPDAARHPLRLQGGDLRGFRLHIPDGAVIVAVIHVAVINQSGQTFQPVPLPVVAQ